MYVQIYLNIKMEKFVQPLMEWPLRFFQIKPEYQEKQELINVFEDADITSKVVLLTFCVAYFIAIQIAISGIFRKYYIM